VSAVKAVRSPDSKAKIEDECAASHNLSSYDATETHRFIRYYDASPAESAIMLAHATANR
jgi:hypothetical protein